MASGAGAPEYVYVFDISRRHLGLVLAVRHNRTAPIPLDPGIWACVATSDADALARAEVAAVHEWPLLQGRHSTDFIVSFQESPGQQSPSTSNDESDAKLGR
jgi:hypothetical protein